MTRGGDHWREPHRHQVGPRLNVLRAGVLGAQDGIVSTAGLVLGVAGATGEASALLVAGIAGLVAGALSMAGGEYSSVSTQRDAERATLAQETWELHTMPEAELDELTDLYERKGLTRDLARQVAVRLTEHDALAAHAEVELGLDPQRLVSPVQAAISSAASFAAGAVLPLLAIVLAPRNVRVAVTIAVVLVALALTGWVSARLGSAEAGRAVARILAVGILAMAITYGIGSLVGALTGAS